jgi:CRP-like cAMP-binding protein
MSTADVLGNVWLFAGLERANLESLANFTFTRTFSQGDVIVEEGRTGNGLYVVVSGQVDVVKGLGTEQAQSLAVLGPGEVFGEMALLGEWPRTASVVAQEETECVGIARWVFLAELAR